MAQGGTLAFMDKAPHPNAARLFINWLLSRKGQMAFQRILQDHDSRRIDIPKDDVPEYNRRREGVKYVIRINLTG